MIFFHQTMDEDEILGHPFIQSNGEVPFELASNDGDRFRSPSNGENPPIRWWKNPPIQW
jgi:hypothetical protein